MKSKIKKVILVGIVVIMFITVIAVVLSRSAAHNNVPVTESVKMEINETEATKSSAPTSADRETDPAQTEPPVSNTEPPASNTEPTQPTSTEQGHTHSWTETVVAPDCVTGGYTTYTCSCGESYTDNKTSALGHVEQIVNGQAATCIESGVTEGVQCDVCKLWIKAQEPIPANGHSEVTVNGKAATCAETGLTEGKQCAVCGVFTVPQEVVPKLNHTYGDWSVEQKPTCTNSGVEKQTCIACGHVNTRYTSPTGVHSYVNGKCTGCGAEVKGSSCLRYTLSSDGTYYMCIGMDTAKTWDEIIIPSYYNGKPVKAVGAGGWGGGQWFCKKVIIMDGVEKINKWAFFGARMEEVHIPNSVTYIGTEAFNACEWLTSVYINTTGWRCYDASETRDYGSANFSDPYQAAMDLRKNLYYFTFKR